MSEYFKTSCHNEQDVPMLVVGIALCPPSTEQDRSVSVKVRRENLVAGRLLGENDELFLPIERHFGTFAELRASIHRQIDHLFDVAEGKT